MITGEQIQIILTAMRSLNPLKIGVFGSMARNDTTEESDIDILYRSNQTVGLFKLIRLQ